MAGIFEGLEPVHKGQTGEAMWLKKRKRYEEHCADPSKKTRCLMGLVRGVSSRQRSAFVILGQQVAVRRHNEIAEVTVGMARDFKHSPMRMDET